MQKAREILPDLIVIAITAHATVETAIQGLETGCL